jgi:hypothetical protein
MVGHLFCGIVLYDDHQQGLGGEKEKKEACVCARTYRCNCRYRERFCRYKRIYIYIYILYKQISIYLYLMYM